jgi:hypothetical protein
MWSGSAFVYIAYPLLPAQGSYFFTAESVDSAHPVMVLLHEDRAVMRPLITQGDSYALCGPISFASADSKLDLVTRPLKITDVKPDAC